ncbi:MAG TPA: MlaD family protein [Pseudonocardiaceae bacterium]|jgi:phospholipid/cholesterol/gamma-HCH transport system substrate-binding protein|nr:MlaD family protein [Pseudonocardiaceae bacterium]
MLTKLVRGQLLAFVLVTVVGVSYACVVYLQVPRLLGIGDYTITLELPQSGGLYPNAVVTYRGVTVGKVEQLTLDPGGVRAVLDINDGVSIPGDSAVSVDSTSAIGEQYVDFQPRAASPPLHDGQVVPGNQVSFPTPVSDFLSSVNQFAATVPLDKLNSTVSEAYQAFNGTGQSLATFLRAAAQLQSLADQNLTPTTRLLQELNPVLATQQRLGPDTLSATENLAGVTDTLQQSDPDIRGAIDQGAPLADSFDQLLTQLSPTLPQLLTDLTSTGQVLRVYLPNVRQLLVVFPAAEAALTDTAAKAVQASGGQNPPPVSEMGFKLTFNNPPPCTLGFDPDRIAPSDLSNSHAPPTDAYCKEPKSSSIEVRGVRNSPCPPGSPTGPGSTGATAADCGWNFQTPSAAQTATQLAIQHMLAVAASNPKTRAENQAFIGNDNFPGPQAGPAPPGINGNGDSSHEDAGGLFDAGGQLFLDGNSQPLPQVSTSTGPVPPLEQYLLAPLMASAQS